MVRKTVFREVQLPVERQGHCAHATGAVCQAYAHSTEPGDVGDHVVQLHHVAVGLGVAAVRKKVSGAVTLPQHDHLFGVEQAGALHIKSEHAIDHRHTGEAVAVILDFELCQSPHDLVADVADRDGRRGLGESNGQHEPGCIVHRHQLQRQGGTGTGARAVAEVNSPGVGEVEVGHVDVDDHGGVDHEQLRGQAVLHHDTGARCVHRQGSSDSPILGADTCVPPDLGTHQANHGRWVGLQWPELEIEVLPVL
mmetsp:Transcript_56815/g.101355  ORF Transcript_56815/g.101355 Transcript_56815/m.101355 type:complete len:252 (-) Transcript_56815:6460-7215(-)